MAGSIRLLRYLFILLPFIYSFFHSGLVRDAFFFVYFLSLLLVIQVRERMRPKREKLLFPVELLLVLAAGIQYGEAVHLCLYSTLISLLGTIGGDFEKRIRVPLLLLCYAALIRLTYFMEPVHQFSLHTMFGVMLLLGYTLERIQRQNEMLGTVYDELRSKHYELEEAKRQMSQDARQLEQLAQANERNRIARDIHDELGHRLIRVKMMSEALAHLHGDASSSFGKLIHQLRDQLAEGMDSLRTTVHRLQPSGSETQRYSLERLIHDFADSSGIDVTLRMEGQPYPLYPSEELTLYRNAQEAMTNAVRHGNATRIAIVLRFMEEAVVFAVENNGSLPENQQLARGMGVDGMEERARRHRGRIEIQSSGPFTVTTYLPHRGKEAQGG